MQELNELNCALYNTAARGDVQEVERLLAAGADMRHKPYGTWMPLHAAAWHGHPAVVRLFLDRGLEVDARSSDDETALNLACQRPGAGHVEVTELRLSRGASVHARDCYGEQPLHGALYFGIAAAAQRLLAAGADVEVAYYGQRPLHIAVEHCQQAVPALIAACEQLDARDGEGRTPLQWAAALGKWNAAEALVIAGASAQGVDTAGLCTCVARPLGERLAAAEARLAALSPLTCERQQLAQRAAGVVAGRRGALAGWAAAQAAEEAALLQRRRGSS